MCIVVLTLSNFSFSVATGGEQKITARFNQPRGTAISWSIEIPDPPPSAVIVMQKIPPGTEVLAATPAYDSFDKSNGTIKWLLHRVVPGKFMMSMKLSAPIRKKGEIHGNIIFQDQTASPTASTTMALIPKVRRKLIEGC